MRILSRMLIGAVALCLGGHAAAQPTDLNAQPGKEWRHKPTKVDLPPSLLNLQRQQVVSYGGDNTDVAGDYRTADNSEVITIYLYRNVSGNVPVWFDRARTIITLLPEKYASPTSTGARPFTPRGQGAPTGLMEIFTLGGNDYRSTGVMVLPVNGFYAKVRASSRTRDAAGLEQLMLAALNAMNWTSSAESPAAAPVADCPTPLPTRAPAKLAGVSSEDQMMAALVGGAIAHIVATGPKAVSPTYCRERIPAQIPYGIYRPVDTADNYMLALLDSGRAIVVGTSSIPDFLSKGKKSGLISITHLGMETTALYPDFESLPHPEQVVELIQTSNPMSTAITWGDKREVQIRAKE